MKAEEFVKNAADQVMAQHAKVIDLAGEGVEKLLAGVKTANVQILGAYKQTPEPFTPSAETISQLQAAMDTYTKLIETTSALVINTSAEFTKNVMEKGAEASLKAASYVKV